MKASEAVVLSLTANNFVEFHQYFRDITLSKFPLVSGLLAKFLDKREEFPEITIDTKWKSGKKTTVTLLRREGKHYRTSAKFTTLY